MLAVQESQKGNTTVGNAAQKTDSLSLENLHRRLANLERGLDSGSQAKATEQKVLELETAEKVVARLMTWAKLFAFVVGIPILVVLVSLGVFVGKKIKDVNDVATTARESLTPILNKARADADRAQTIATNALQTSNDINRTVQQTREGLSLLRTEVANRATEAERLREEIKRSQSELAGVTAAVASQSKEIGRLTQQVQAVAAEKNIARIREVYPIFGKRVAGSRDGWIDISQKPPHVTYINFNLAVWARNRLSEERIGQAVTSLQARKYRVFLGPVSLYATTGTSSQGLGAEFDEFGCKLAGRIPPCILYFDQRLKSTALEVRDLVRTAQTVPDDGVQYVEPIKLEALVQELLQKSGIDILVVLGGSSETAGIAR